MLGPKKAAVMAMLQKKENERDGKAKELRLRLDALISKMKPDELAGLQAQLSILNSPSLGPVLSFETAKDEIDLREVLKNNQIAYFQLDTLGSADTGRRLGRMIIEDVKGLASYVYQTQPDVEQRKFFSIFIDEFGSFASKEFIEVLKQIRGAKFGALLFTQGLEDLDAVSTSFQRQAKSNPITKIAFRLDDKITVDEVCAMAGTIEAVEQSHQVQGSLFSPIKTGLGSQRDTRQMIIEHDVLKNLDRGQAIVIDKSPSSVAAVEVFHPEILCNLPPLRKLHVRSNILK